MLPNPLVYATLPAQDIERAKNWYADRLGLEPTEEFPQDGSSLYDTGNGWFLLFPSKGAATGAHTQMSFDVADIEATVKALRDNGVVFEEYDYPDLKTVDGIADLGYEKGAWFKDSEGNLIALGERLAGKAR